MEIFICANMQTKYKDHILKLYTAVFNSWLLTIQKVYLIVSEMFKKWEEVFFKHEAQLLGCKICPQIYNVKGLMPFFEADQKVISNVCLTCNKLVTLSFFIFIISLLLTRCAIFHSLKFSTVLPLIFFTNYWGCTYIHTKSESIQAVLIKQYPLCCWMQGTYPHPSSQLTGLLGLCSQSLRWDCSWSNLSVAVQP